VPPAPGPGGKRLRACRSAHPGVAPASRGVDRSRRPPV